MWPDPNKLDLLFVEWVASIRNSQPEMEAVRAIEEVDAHR